jgi:dephospho-CoA kinase
MALRGRQRPRPVVIGLTGAIASGKSTVAGMLRQRGAEVIDADLVYHSLLAAGSLLNRRLVARFGPGILDSSGNIDRAALGRIVFADPAALADLDRITHPAVAAEIRRRVARATAPVVVIEAIKLVQSGLSEAMDAIWVVAAPPDIRLGRLIERGVLDREAAEQRLRIAFDPLSDDFTPDVVIDTSGALETTARQVDEAWRSLGLDASPVTDEQQTAVVGAKEEA